MKTTQDLKHEILEVYKKDYNLLSVELYCKEQEYDYSVKVGSIVFVKIHDTKNNVRILLQLKIMCISL